MTVSQQTVNINRLEQMIETYSSIDWFSNVGKKEEMTEQQLQQCLNQLGVSDFQIEWVTIQESADVYQRLTFQDSRIWEAIRDLPDRWTEKITENSHDAALKQVVEFLPEAVFQYAFDGAYKQFDEQKLINYMTGMAMYLTLMIAVSDLAEEGEQFEPIRQMIASGHIPFGIEGNTIYLM
ncbi:hypothetical protein [Aquibacillus sediminis]|uniref:hypothetical protein n=1 Tax=Aquibacillus sediminis TaxID=2574734 RepID=UPI0011099AF4|nr:hypothetical protein [Aquibacillus sediminis]